MQLADYHAKYFAHELTKRCPSDSAEKLAGALVDAQVDLNQLPQHSHWKTSWRGRSRLKPLSSSAMPSAVTYLMPRMKLTVNANA